MKHVIFLLLASLAFVCLAPAPADAQSGKQVDFSYYIRAHDQAKSFIDTLDGADTSYFEFNSRDHLTRVSQVIWTIETVDTIAGGDFSPTVTVQAQYTDDDSGGWQDAENFETVQGTVDATAVPGVNSFHVLNAVGRKYRLEFITAADENSYKVGVRVLSIEIPVDPD